MIKIIDLNKDTVKHFKKCFENNGIEKEIDSINWQFLQNTLSRSFVDIAYDDEVEKTAAIYAVSCSSFKIGNATINATQSMDTMTDIDYRGQGLFIKLANGVYKKAKDAGMALVYGFPNGNSIYGFQKKLGWKVLDPVPFLIKPLNSKYFTDKIKILNFLPNIKLSFSKFKENKNFKISKKNSFPIEVDDLWAAFSKDIKVSVIRDKAYLDWRYINKPNEDYSIAHCFDKNNLYLGFIVYTVKEKHGGNIGYIMELMYDTQNPKLGKLLLKYAIDEMKFKNADCVLAWSLEHSPNYTAYSKSHFWKIPEKFKPIELHFGVRTLQDKYKELVEDRKNWYISYSDSDTV